MSIKRWFVNSEWYLNLRQLPMRTEIDNLVIEFQRDSPTNRNGFFRCWSTQRKRLGLGSSSNRSSICPEVRHAFLTERID